MSYLIVSLMNFALLNIPTHECFPHNQETEYRGPTLEHVESSCIKMSIKGGALPETNEIVTHICSCHNFFPLSSVQILFIPACCLLCVL